MAMAGDVVEGEVVTRKRRRLAWDYAGPPADLQLASVNLPNVIVRDSDAAAASASFHNNTSCFYPRAEEKHYYVSPPPLPPRSWKRDDKDGHIMFDLGDNLTSRYEITRKMGEGERATTTTTLTAAPKFGLPYMAFGGVSWTFGRVLECWDRDAHERVAIKVIRNVPKYRDAAMIEIDVLKVLADRDKVGTRSCVQMRRWFDYCNHICIVCEKLGPSLYDFLKANNYRSFSVDLVREFGFQLLESVAYIHDLDLIHTDLKPENILLVSSDYSLVHDDKKSLHHEKNQFKRVPNSSHIKLIDFGSATYESQYHSKIVSTRHYRAPEVIIGLGWSYPCDVWSVGCILVELCSGEALFKTHEDLEHLAMMERVLGPIPQHMMKRVEGGSGHKLFRYSRRLNWPEGAVSRESIRAVRKLPHLKDLVLQNMDPSCCLMGAGLFVNLLQGLLKFDPEDRFTAREALAHPFFRASSLRRRSS